jgi:hypothetical protein
LPRARTLQASGKLKSSADASVGHRLAPSPSARLALDSRVDFLPQQVLCDLLRCRSVHRLLLGEFGQYECLVIAHHGLARALDFANWLCDNRSPPWRHRSRDGSTRAASLGTRSLASRDVDFAHSAAMLYGVKRQVAQHVLSGHRARQLASRCFVRGLAA